MNEQTHHHRLFTFDQVSPSKSPQKMRYRVGNVIFAVVWTLVCRFSPKPFNGMRVMMLKLFGAKISGRPYIAPSCRIRMPWNLELEDRVALAYNCEIYNPGKVTIRKRATVAQHSFVCAAGHDVTKEALPLQLGPIEIGADAFIFAGAFIAPGVHIGEGAVIGGGSVVVKDMPPWMICAGNPCKPIKPRVFPRGPHRINEEKTAPVNSS